MPQPMPSATVEDYIKAIYIAQYEAPPQQAPKGRAAPGSVSLGDLASRMSVVPGTATSMVKALSDANLVLYEPRRGVRLTPAGEKLALHVLRKHRIVELFLVQILKLDWSEVHEEAEALEHAISDKVLDKLDELLGYPSADPHGDPIPSTSGELIPTQSRPLMSCQAGDEVSITRIDNQDPAFLRYAESQGLTPGTPLTIHSTNPQADSITLSTRDGPQTTLGSSAASKIQVTP